MSKSMEPACGSHITFSFHKNWSKYVTIFRIPYLGTVHAIWEAHWLHDEPLTIQRYVQWKEYKFRPGLLAIAVYEELHSSLTAWTLTIWPWATQCLNQRTGKLYFAIHLSVKYQSAFEASKVKSVVRYAWASTIWCWACFAFGVRRACTWKQTREEGTAECEGCADAEAPTVTS
jgi:hypothetical protein